MNNIENVVAWSAGFYLRGGLPMLGNASIDEATVTRQVKLPDGWTDVVSGTAPLEGWYETFAGPGVEIHYKVVDRSEAMTGYQLFTVPSGSSMDVELTLVEVDHEQARKNAGAIALLDAWLRNAEQGYDDAQARHLSEVKKSLDAERLPGQKLFP